MTLPKQTIKPLGNPGSPLDRPVVDPTALDPRALFTLGLSHIQSLASRVWNDYNLHDPGITTLELLCYAITDLSYRASLPIEELLADKTGSEAAMIAQFGSAARLLPMRPLTRQDYRKLLIDLPGVRNAWLQPEPLRYFADTIQGKLLRDPPPEQPGVQEVRIAGLYQPVLELEPDADPPTILANVVAVLHRNRNLCEDFAAPAIVTPQSFNLCAEIELTPDAVVATVQAAILARVERYLAPPLGRYTLKEMLERSQPDGSPYTVDAILDGPLPRLYGTHPQTGQLELSIPAYEAEAAQKQLGTLYSRGFIDDSELLAAELRTRIYLSELIGIITEIPGVVAIRDILISPTHAKEPQADRWVVAVQAGHRATLRAGVSRLVFYKRQLPVTADFTPPPSDGKRPPLRPADVDVAIPRGTWRQPTEYYSVQNHFPANYRLSELGPPAHTDDRRYNQILQLRGYLLFFDQLMANYLAQLAHVRELFSSDPTITSTYYSQAVQSFRNHAKLYVGGADADPHKRAQAMAQAAAALLPPDDKGERRSRFLDHLIARFAERFHDFANIMRARALSPADEDRIAAELIADKCAFVNSYPALSAERAQGYNHAVSDPKALWESLNVSGLEKRIAGLLGIKDARRRELAKTEGAETEGMYLFECLLLRPPPAGAQDIFLPICGDPGGTCRGSIDPYSYQIYIVLPAWVGRFAELDFRRFAERTIRQEVPAHILPRICWVGKDQMTTLQKAYHDWLMPAAGASAEQPRAREPQLQKLIGALSALRNVYPTQTLHGCGDDDGQGTFVLNRTALGTLDNPNS